jgi:hypothetical protein
MRSFKHSVIYVFAFLLALCALAIAARAEDPIPLNKVIEQISKAPDISEVERVKGDDLTVFLAAYDAVPPVSHTQADMIVTFYHEGAPGVLVLFCQSDMVVTAKVIPVGIYGKLRNGIVPGPSA